MKKSVLFPLMLVISGSFLVNLTSCGVTEDSNKTKESRKKSDQLKTEADQVASEVAQIQTRIRDYGNPETTSVKVVEGLLMEEERVKGEATKLAKMMTDLKLANASLLKEKGLFGQKYLTP